MTDGLKFPTFKSLFYLQAQTLFLHITFDQLRLLNLTAWTLSLRCQSGRWASSLLEQSILSYVSILSYAAWTHRSAETERLDLTLTPQTQSCLPRSVLQTFILGQSLSLNFVTGKMGAKQSKPCPGLKYSWLLSVGSYSAEDLSLCLFWTLRKTSYWDSNYSISYSWSQFPELRSWISFLFLYFAIFCLPT